jgi:polyisoprenoid-binding protein YceI
MKKTLLTSLLLATSFISQAQAAEYIVDTKGAHASINFKVSHLGFSFVTGRFNNFTGSFSYDKDQLNASNISIEIDPASVDTNHAERNNHLRGKKFLDVAQFKNAKFISTKVVDLGAGKLAVTGDLTLHGITKNIVIDSTIIGEGNDPWGGYRVGFTGTTKIAMKDFEFGSDFGEVQFELIIEGVRQ